MSAQRTARANVTTSTGKTPRREVPSPQTPRSHRRVDVVHEDRVAADLLPCHERAAHVPTAGIAGEPRLARDPSPPGEKRRDRKAPEPSELAGERFGRLVPATQAAIAVGRDIRDGVCCRRGHSPGDELGGQGRERAELRAPSSPVRRRGQDRRRRLPHGPTRRRASSRRTRGNDRPARPWSAAAGAERRVNWHQPDAAAVAEERSGLSAGDATRGNEELEEPRRPD